jgi:hypothetical protein
MRKRFRRSRVPPSSCLTDAKLTRILLLVLKRTRQFCALSAAPFQTPSERKKEKWVLTLFISDGKHRFTDFLQLILDFKPGDTLIDSLYRYTKAVTIRDYRCDSCSQRAGEPVEIAIRKRTLLGQLPNALCLQLKLAGGDLFKIDAFVKFPLVLDMGPFSVSSNPVEFFGARHPHDRFDQVSEMRSKVDHEVCSNLFGSLFLKKIVSLSWRI